MIGDIYSQLEHFVLENHDLALWNTALAELQLPSNGVYVSGEFYPDDEALALVNWFANRLEIAVPDLLRKFGQFLFHQLKHKHAAQGIHKEDFFTFVGHIESTTHTLVRQMSASSTPPELTVTRQGNQLSIHYQSERQLCFLAEGLLQGCAEHYELAIDIEQTTCMHRGDEFCTIVVTVHD